MRNLKYNVTEFKLAGSNCVYFFFQVPVVVSRSHIKTVMYIYKTTVPKWKVMNKYLKILL